jgi:hypothetical protein
MPYWKKKNRKLNRDEGPNTWGCKEIARVYKDSLNVYVDKLSHIDDIERIIWGQKAMTAK